MATENDNFEVLVESAFEVEPGAKKENLLVGLVSEVEIAQEVLSRELQTCRLTTWKLLQERHDCLKITNLHSLYMTLCNIFSRSDYNGNIWLVKNRLRTTQANLKPYSLFHYLLFNIQPITYLQCSYQFCTDSLCT